jgi:hypothetical protein
MNNKRKMKKKNLGSAWYEGEENQSFYWTVCGRTGAASSEEPTVGISSQLWIGWWRQCGLQSAMMVGFIPKKLINATNQGLYSCRDLVIKQLPA